jgi:hypothetical protein
MKYLDFDMKRVFNVNSTIAEFSLCCVYSKLISISYEDVLTCHRHSVYQLAATRR